MVWIVRMPKAGQTMESGLVQQWLKKEGDVVSQGEVIAVVESEKCSQEIEARQAGILRKILVSEGSEVAPGAPIGLVAGTEEELPEVTAACAEKQAVPVVQNTSAPGAVTGQKEDSKVKATPAAKKLALEIGVSISGIAGTGPGGVVTREDVERYMKMNGFQEL